MVLRDKSERPAAPTEGARPAPPASQTSPGRRLAAGPHPHAAVGKRFTVRDGFHLKTRNAEAQAAIDAQVTARSGEPPDPLLLPESDEDVHLEIPSGPTKVEITAALPSPGRVLRANRSDSKSSNNNNGEDHDHHEADKKAGDDLQPDAAKRTTSAAVAVLGQLLQPEQSNQDSSSRSSSREGTTGRVRAALRAPAEWLVYRHRPSDTKQREQRKVAKQLHEILQEAEPQKLTDAKQDEVRAPRRPRCQSTLGSTTYKQRVAAARPQKHLPSEHKHSYHRESLEPLTETERGLLRSREDNNKAVDKLLVSLFHPPSAAATPATAATSLVPAVKPTTTLTNRFSTRRSVMRHETAVALRSRNLVSRMNELRSLPQLLEQMETLQLWKQQQQIAQHGVDIVARNRANPTLHVLQKPSQTPLLPSATDHKLHQANRRKQELDAAKEENVRRIVIRWQLRREQRAEQARGVHVQSQWLLIVALAESSNKWLTKFHEFRQRRGVLVRVMMARRLQRYWRQRALNKRDSLHLLRFAPLSSAFFRLPVVIHAVTKLQQSVRDWLERKHHRERTDTVALIVTAWFEFQDVKFRRIILRFRKRVRDFQVMWRAWRAITAARIKLLLLVWAKVERKVKRRHGVAASHPSVTFSLPNDPLQLKGGSDDAIPAGKGLTLLDMLQCATAERPLNQQQKQLEDMHRHFRNGGAVHMPIGAVSPGSLGSLGPHSPTNTNSPSRGLQASPPSPSSRRPNRPRQAENAHVRQDLELRNNMEEEFQLVMYDVYTTRRNLSPKSSKSPARSTLGAAQTRDAKQSPSKTRNSSPRGSQGQHPPLQLPTGSPTVPVPPSSKRVPHQLKVTVLRKLLSEKRKMYSDTRDRGREAWAAARKQMRSEAFRYDVLDELAAFQQLQAKYATFLLLHSITETDMVHLIHQTQEEVNAAETAAKAHPSQTHRKSIQGRGAGPRKSHVHIDITTNAV
ncbi:hypothetical protein PHYPSEUDO_006265 [Phytophthora pseudosyringae]|uniref:Uncharacterized protein n=1 Tax=Phytophthora pseudosyringae TaxID=221518 RepID=A0A8T1VMB5_9STRA|nr:hypothetical protein PHYPSEUDO_006265 [Phytophthora pseudosyringae]